MTNDEKLMQRTERDAAICAYYLAGHKLKECASAFQLGRQRVLKILQTAGVWRPYVAPKSTRTKFLGVTISPETRDALKVKADEEGKSVSQFTSDVLDEVVGRDSDVVVERVMKHYYWFARIPDGGYGKWVPTGQTDFVAARDYIREVYGGPVREWLRFPVA